MLLAELVDLFLSVEGEDSSGGILPYALKCMSD
jgi:hypothetical protein